MTAIAGADPEFAGLVVDVRSKADHIILMASMEDDDKLRQGVPWLRQWGLQAKEYHREVRKDGIANAANHGLQALSRKSGICDFFARNEACQFGARGACKYTCYPTG